MVIRQILNESTVVSLLLVCWLLEICLIDELIVSLLVFQVVARFFSCFSVV